MMDETRRGELGAVFPPETSKDVLSHLADLRDGLCRGFMVSGRQLWSHTTSHAAAVADLQRSPLPDLPCVPLLLA